MSEPKSLAGYVDQIRDRPEDYRVVRRQVNPMDFSLTAILQHLEHRGEFPAVMFENPLNMHGDPSNMRVLMNLWATRERCAEAVGVSREEAGIGLGSHYATLAQQPLEPKVVTRDEAPVQANVFEGSKADMWTLPVGIHAEMDLGGVLTMALAMHAPGEEFYNITFVKTFPETGDRGGLTIHSKDMVRMWRAWERRGEPIPVINILGHHPGFWIGTLNNTPYGDNEYATAGGFLGEPVRLAPSVTWGRDFLIPADAEIIIEGEITPGEKTIVDPFGEISRQYQGQQFAPVMNVKAITHRDNPIMQDIFTGHRDHMILGSIGHEGSVFNEIQRKFGNVVAVHFPMSGNGRHTAYVSINKTGESQPKQAAVATLAHSPLLVIVVVVDGDIDPFNEEDVIWAISTYVDPNRDIDIIKNLGVGGDDRGLDNNRVIIDATRPSHVAFPTRLRVPPEAMDRIHLDDWLEPIEVTK